MPANAFRPWRPRRGQAGFGLLEVIVAFAILAIAGSTLFSWINQSLATAVRLRDLEYEAQLNLNAQALMAGVNPMRDPSGERVQASVRVRWESEQVAPLRFGPVGGEGQTLGFWTVGLYLVHVRADDGSNGAAVAFDLTQTGFVARPEAQKAVEESRGQR